MGIRSTRVSGIVHRLGTTSGRPPEASQASNPKTEKRKMMPEGLAICSPDSRECRNNIPITVECLRAKGKLPDIASGEASGNLLSHRGGPSRAPNLCRSDMVGHALVVLLQTAILRNTRNTPMSLTFVSESAN